MEGFNHLLLKLREAHEREVEGWQVKIQELSNKKGCDTRRMEELFSKNQQMKEQQRLLNETIQTLENRLRAGLCDRCTVTQELARRRQQEFEASHMQTVQHISLIAGEMNTLKKENKRLKEEVKALRAALHEQSSSFNSAELKLNTPPDLSPSGPVALVATATSKTSQQPADGDGARTTEVEHRKEDGEQRPWRSRRHLESYKPLSAPPARTSDRSASYAGEKRPPSVEVVDQQPFISPQSLLLKTSSGGEVNPSRLVLHTPLPCRPQPIKGSAVSLPWSSPPLSSLMMSPSHKPNVLPFPSLAPAEGLRPGPLSLWHKQGAARVNPAEQTVLFRLRSLPEHTQAPAKTLERKDKPACWTEKLGAEGPREAYEGPLDLSERGKSTPTDYSPPEPAQDSPEGGPKTEPSPQGSSSSPGSPEEEPAAGSKTQLRSGRLEEQQQHAELENERRTNLMWQQESKEQEQEEMNGMTEQSSDKKVPVLTISLRPVVVLETLNPALQKQEALTPNDKASSAEAENRQEEQDSDQEGKQSCKRKRSAVDPEPDLDVNHIHQERKVRITRTTEEKS